MGAHSTMTITRNDALTEINRKLLTASDEDLECILFDLVDGDGKLFTFKIINDYEETDEENYEEKYTPGAFDG